MNDGTAGRPHRGRQRWGLRLHLLAIILVVALPITIGAVFTEIQRAAERANAFHAQILEKTRLIAAQEEGFIDGARYLLAMGAEWPEMLADAATCGAALARFKQRFPEISGIGTILPNGDLFCSATPSPAPVNVADRDYFRTALASGRLAMSGYVVNRRAGTATIVLAQPVFGPDGAVARVLAVSFLPERLFLTLGAPSLPDGTSIALIDEQGVVVASTGPGNLAPGSVVTGNPAYAALLGGRLGLVEGAGPDGVARVFAGVWLKPPAPLMLVVGMPAERAHGGQAALFALEMAVVLGAVLFAVAAGLIAIELVLGLPLARLTAAVDDLAAGDLGVRPKPDSRIAEVADLARAVNVMADIIEGRDTRLRAAKEAAEQAVAAKSRFLAAASHDLRQPFQAMRLFQSLLQQRVTGKRNQLILAKLSEAMGVGEALLKALLDVSQLDSGMVRPKLGDFPCSALFDRLAATFAAEAEGKGINLRVAPCAAVLHSDPVLLERLLGRLVANAIRFTDRGGVLIGGRIAGTSLRIEVRDTGCGIPADCLEQVFEDFFQLGNPERDHRRGLGLGLSVVRRTAALLDHPVTVRSSLGRGSVFAVTVPLSAWPHDRARDVPARLAGPVEPAQRRR